ncbi:MAG: ABC transporter permease, partial [Blastocatellia bacterium]
MWAIRWADELAKDIRYGIRMIRKSPVLASVVVLSLALAIGANTAIFSLVDAVLLRTLPVKNPNQLVLFEWSGSDSCVDDHEGSTRPDQKTGKVIGSSLTYQQFKRMGEANQTLSDLFAFTPIYNKLNVSTDGQADVASGQFVSGGYYKGLGLPAIVGRTITEEDDKDGAAPVAVISYGYWKKRFNLDPTVVGEPAYINALPFAIVGISPQGFDGALDAGQTADVSLPLSTEGLVDRQPAQEGIVWEWWLRVMGRLKPGATIEQARENLEPVFQRTALEGHQAYIAKYPERKDGEAVAPNLVTVSGSRGGTFYRGDYSGQLYILLA